MARPARIGLALCALLVAVATAHGVAVVVGPIESGSLPVLYVLSAAVSVFMPAAIVLQVVLGQVLLATLFVGPAGIAWLPILAGMGGVVLTAELLGVAARMRGAVARDFGADLRRLVVATSLAVVVLATVLLVGRLPGPRGLVAIAIAALALIVAALVLVRDTGWTRPG